MKDLNLNERANEIGGIISRRLESLKSKYSSIGDVRGIGAMLALEFVKNGDPRQPDSELCSRIIKGCAAAGLILLSAGTFKNVIRILSPLVITDDQLNQGLDIMEQEIKQAIENQNQ
jgi:4-aminobutyrate aminotransferase/(S)-3-amino-2-methylpropionate transaminase